MAPWLPGGVVLAAVLLFLVWAAHVARNDPRAAFLLDEGPGRWMKAPTETTIVAFFRGPQWAIYRFDFQTETVPDSAELQFTAFRNAQVFLDGRSIYSGRPDPDGWKRQRRHELPAPLVPGGHSLIFAVSNDLGPPMLRAAVVAGGTAVPGSWTVSRDAERWTPVWPADRIPPPEIASAFPPVRRHVLRTLPVALAIFLGAGAVSLNWGRMRPAFRNRLGFLLEPDRLQWVAAATLLALGVNNLARLRLAVGSDIGAHYEYIHYVAENFALPRVSEGLQSFQAPLFYVLSGAAYRALVPFMAPELADRLLRVIPIFCGIGIVVITRQLAAQAFPSRRQLQSAAVLLAATLPMLVYKTQTATNEPLAALLGAAVLLLLTRLVTESGPVSTRYFVLLGLVWGLAVLAKVSALALAPVVASAVAWWLYAERPGLRSAAGRLGSLAAVFAITCAWFFVRNQALYGKPFVGGWDPLIGFEWWQFPGYRTVDQYLSFGRALDRPIFAATAGPWDGLYAGLWCDSNLSGVPNLVSQPKWNFGFMLAAVWWGIVPSAALGIGMLRTLRPGTGDPREAAGNGGARVRVLCLFAAGAYFAAVLAHTVTLPYYNAAKPTYALAAAPAMAILMSWGLEPLLRARWRRAVVHGWLAAWAAIVCAAYFALAS